MLDSKDFVANGTANSADCETSSYSDSSFWDKLKRFAKMAGSKLVYIALVLHYAFHSPNTPAWAKTVIVSALVYFICPIDAIPDTIPVIGFTDDLAALTAAYKAVNVCVTPDVIAKAKATASKLFGYAVNTEVA